MTSGLLSDLIMRAPMSEVSAYLDSLPMMAREDEMTTLTREDQRRLFDRTVDHRKLRLEDVAIERRPTTHAGYNTFPRFRHFAKLMCRTSEGVCGYNRLPYPGGETLVGPGYFMVRPHRIAGELLIDYQAVPHEKPPQWPTIHSNRRRLSRFIYHGTQDVLRGVSTHVTIGRAFRGRTPLPSWFLLCRRDEPSEMRLDG